MKFQFYFKNTETPPNVETPSSLGGTSIAGWGGEIKTRTDMLEKKRGVVSKTFFYSKIPTRYFLSEKSFPEKKKKK